MQASVAPGAKALSAIKGIDFDDKGIVLISDIIRKELSADCSVLMGANVRPYARTNTPYLAFPRLAPTASETGRKAGRACLHW